MKNLFSRKLLAGLAVLVGLSTIAFALTTPPSISPRRVPLQTTTHYRATINWNDGNIGNGIKFGAVPAGAFMTAFKCYVWTAFNAATTNHLNVGTTQAFTAPTTGGGDWIYGAGATTAACQLATAGYQNISTANGHGFNVTSPTTTTGSSGGWDLWVRYAQSGTAATAGKVTLIIEYVPDDDM